MMSPFLNFMSGMANKMLKPPTDFDNYLDWLDGKYGTNALDFISQKPPEAQAPMVDSANLIKETNAMAGVSNPALAMLQSNAQAAPTTPSLPMYDPRSNNLPMGALAEPEESKEMRNIKEPYEAVADKQAFLQNRQRQPFSFFG